MTSDSGVAKQYSDYARQIQETLDERSRTYALRTMFRDLSQSGCVACISWRSVLDMCF
jgi:hypothetical protein